MAKQGKFLWDVKVVGERSGYDHSQTYIIATANKRPNFATIAVDALKAAANDSEWDTAPVPSVTSIIYRGSIDN